MRKGHSVLLAALVFAAPACFAETITVTFNPIGQTTSDTFSFTVPAAPTSSTAPNVFHYSSSTVTFSDPGGPAIENVAFTNPGIFQTVIGAPLDFAISYDGGDVVADGVQYEGAQIYSNSVTDPVFTPGASFTVYDTAAGSDDTATITISDAAPSVAPEPSSLLLFGTGLAGFATVLRRRFAA